jgi:hypothetical protein
MQGYLLCLLLLCIFSPASSQTNDPAARLQLFETLEANLRNNRALQSTAQQLNDLKVQAIAAQDDISHARSRYDLLIIRDKQTEDSLYFQNSAFMDTLIDSRSTSPTLKVLMYLLRAHRLAAFEVRPQRFNTAAYRSSKLKVDYAALSYKQRNEMIDDDYASALRINAVKGNPALLSWLPIDPACLALNESLEDIVRAAQIVWLSQRYNDPPSIQSRKNKMLQLSSPAFRKILDSLSMIVDQQNPSALLAYRNWIHETQRNPEKSTFVEALARQYIYSSTTNDSIQIEAYVRYLQNSSTSKYQSVKLHAIYRLCLLWNEQGNRYAEHPQFQFHRKKVLDLYEQNAEAFKNHPVYDQPLADMVRQIRAAGVQVVLEDKQLPDQQIPIKVKYKNTAVLFYRIIRITAAEGVDKLNEKFDPAWLTAKPVAQGSFDLSLPDDHQLHDAKLNLPKLPIGSYRLLFAKHVLGEDTTSLNGLTFQVSSIAAINDDKKIFILNRSTGVPLAGARVQYLQQLGTKKQPAVFRVKKDGHVDLPEQPAGSLLISKPGDTLRYPIYDSGYRTARIRQDQDDADDLLDFYSDQLRMEIFTDRSIYRPGQTVHYKLILMTRNPKTQQPMLLNKENLGSATFARWMKAFVKNGDNKIKLTDPFGKVIDSALITINNFSSFAGSFIISKQAALGSWYVRPATNYTASNAGGFRVEEYKRPTIELSMEKQQKMRYPGQRIDVNLKVRAFSGATLNNTPISYTITRNFYHPWDQHRGRLYSEIPAMHKLADTTLYTDAKGNVSFSIDDAALRKYDIKDDQRYQIRYSIIAKAVDATGESTVLEASIDVSSRPVDIAVDVEETYDRQNLSALPLETTNIFEGLLSRPVHVQLFRNGATSTDTSLVKTLVLDTLVHTGKGGKIHLSKDKVSTGYFQLVLTSMEAGRTLGFTEYNFSVFDSKSNAVPEADVNYIAASTVKPGEEITWYSSGKKDNYTIYKVMYNDGSEARKVISIYMTKAEQAGLRTWTFRVPKKIVGKLLLQRMSVSDNEIKRFEKELLIERKEIAEEPAVVVENYRSILAPGAKAWAKVSLKTKDTKVVSELLTTVYDATLDQLNKHHWRLPNMDAPQVYLANSWSYTITNDRLKGDVPANQPWIYPKKYSTADLTPLLVGRAMDLETYQKMSLNEVSVVGYAQSSQRIQIRGNTSLAGNKEALIIVDGKVFVGNLNSLDPTLIRDMVVLTDQKAVAIYGSKAAHGAIVISTSGKIVLPGMEDVPVKIRKNFNETAFFHPQLQADRDGYFSFSYTMPESATTWNWKMLAHTAKGTFSYLERTIQTQLNLMVQPNVPRFLYQGDQLQFQSRISNLDTLAISGTAKLKIEDAVTGADLTSIITAESNFAFSLQGKTSTAVTYALRIPAKQTNPLKVIVTATSGSVADAEEHILPILSTRIFLQQQQPIKNAGQTAAGIAAPKLPADAELQGLSVSINQKPTASLLYALPSLANGRSETAEQIFDKIYAHIVAMNLLQRDTTLRSALRESKDSAEQAEDSTHVLPKEITADLMPWLGLNTHVATQQRALSALLDSVTARQKVGQQLEKLYKLQQSSGGMAWFDGGRPNADVSAYVLAGFGRLQPHFGLMNLASDPSFDTFLQKLLADQRELATTGKTGFMNLKSLYAVSYWLKKYPLTAANQEAAALLLRKAWSAANTLSLEQQALLIINTFRYVGPKHRLYAKAYEQLENIRQLAIEDEQNGLRWKAIADGENMDRSAEETLALLAEAFEGGGKYDGLDAKLVKWLLTTRSGESWQTTAGTAAAIGLLQKQKIDLQEGTKSMVVNVDDHVLAVSDDLLKGKPMDYISLKEIPKNIKVSATGTGTAGDLTWYYFANPDRQEHLNKALKIEKALYVSRAGEGLQKITPTTVLKAGERVQVKLKVETSTNLKFVHIKDGRVAAFEPQQVKSGYQYTDKVGFYQVTRDTGAEFFVEMLPRGITEFTYDLVVAQGGTFHNAPATVQSMHKLGLAAYSDGSQIKVK